MLDTFTSVNTNLWASTYQSILQSHSDPNGVRFWLDALSWDRAEHLGPGKIRVFLSAPNPFYVDYIKTAYLAELESAIKALVGQSAEVVITSGQKSEAISGQPPLQSNDSHLNLAPDSEEEGYSDSASLNSKMDAIQKVTLNPLSPPRFEDIQTTPIQRMGAPSPSRSPFSSGNFSSEANGFQKAASKQTRLMDHVDSHLSFDNYIVGPSNQFAYASAFSTAEQPAVQFNPLFIYGPPAVGKTHLLHAIGNHIKKQNPHIRAYFVSAENFVNEFIESLQHKNPGAFRAKYRESVDLLLIDDVQFIVGKDRSEEEFIHTFNTLHSLKKMIVLTSDKAPKDIDGLEERIRTRFEMGLVADIRPPEIETRIAILKAKAEADDVYLPDDVATFLGTYVKDTVRNLHGALVKLQQYASLTGSEITLDLAKQVLQHAIPEEGQEYTVEMILNAVCKHFGIKLKELKGVSRAKMYANPRQIAMYLIRRYTTLGFREIGLIFGKDHTSVVHAHKKIEIDQDIDVELRRNIEQIREQL